MICHRCDPVGISMLAPATITHLCRDIADARGDQHHLMIAQVLGILTAGIERMDDGDRARAAWHLANLAARLDPDLIQCVRH